VSAVAWRLVVLGLTLVLLLAAGAGIGVWLAADHYRPLLDTATRDLAMTKSGRDNLETLASEQGRRLGELVQARREREALARKAMTQAQEEAKPDYAAANRLMQERIGGDQCTAAITVIDQELGL
jgi:hypothetical protein